MPILKPSSMPHTTALETYYQDWIVKHHLHADAAQMAVLGHLQPVLDQLTRPPIQREWLKLLKKQTLPRQVIYIFGEVGRGKSMIMDLFFQACPLQKKRRVHFHSFMQEVHQFMHHWRQTQTGDPLMAYAKQLRQQIRLLCFDEFHVSDIADAMILSRLFEQLFACGLIMIATSNQHPDELYLNGLQRELFLPFIDKLKQTAEIIELVSKADYRLAHLTALKQTVYIGQGATAKQFLQYSLAQLIHQAETEPATLKVQGRLVSFKAAHGDILYSSFTELCRRPLAAADYLAIAQQFHTVFIADIPQLSAETADQAKRFMILIDALYEVKAKLIATVAVPVAQLYLCDNQLDYRRTQSRLIEMQSEYYLKIPHSQYLLAA